MKNNGLFLLLLLAFNPSALGTVIFNDGKYHRIGYGVTYDNVYVDASSPNRRTRVEVTSGGHVTGGIQYYEDAIGVISGGVVDYGVDALHRAAITMSGGQVYFLRGFHDSQITVTGGIIHNNLGANGNCRLTFSAGRVDAMLYAENNAVAEVSGGIVHELLRAQNGGLIKLYGSGFSVNGKPVDDKDTAAMYGSSGIITGMLQNGDPLAVDYLIFNGGDIVFIPEPATLLLLGLGGVLIRKH